MKYVIKDIKTNFYLNLKPYHILHWTPESKTIFNNKWEANRVLKTLENKRNFENFRIEEYK